MENSTEYLVRNEPDKIPFVDILLSYAERFLYDLEQINASNELIDKLHLTLLQELSLVAEITLQEELAYFKGNETGTYQEFVETTNLVLAVKYPVLDNILKTIANNYLKHIQNIFSNFSKDFYVIAEVFSLETNKNIIIEDIDTGLGDGHRGESTALITLADGTKLIYKPRNIDVAISYNQFIDWVNRKLTTDLKTIKCLNCGSYGWLEFIPYRAAKSPDELQEYYYKAGILLAVTLLLGSKDCHYENIIASGSNPVIVDHETIIQPVLSNQSIRTWDDQHNVPHFSVLESMLIVSRHTGIPLAYAGYGSKGNVEAMDLAKKVIDPNTIDSRRNTRFVFRKLVKDNVPLYKDTHVFANAYKNSFIAGFSATYDVFMDSREELISCNSPIQFFDNRKIRYVWRPSFVYFSILKYMRSASFMSSFETYRSKLYELMSKAYQKGNFSDYKFILKCEMEQLLAGNIPLFNLDSLACHLEEDKSFKIFRYHCIENIKRRVRSLSIHHKNEQIEHITKWLTTIR
ncbi:type 2 lanthipeptide synthetase LanM [Parapedobacter tibetensis]|uniref:type 2 lanthipeptide synthetase LanM n=1 Tax=Parapedobacter tibetensis TaxID=2972951 RepID=UPI00214D552B|nr:type 2 lanthipeptide synthetase LanM [Parapedobacter tibetensis]